jgi:hypothetical protein
MSLALRGLVSGASNISRSCSISSMMRSMSMRPNIQHKGGKNQTETGEVLHPSDPLSSQRKILGMALSSKILV